MKIYPRLQSLLVKNFFRFYKVNLKQECPFWPDDSRCAIRFCQVENCEEQSIPEGIKEKGEQRDKAASYKVRNSRKSNLSTPLLSIHMNLIIAKCRYSDYSIMQHGWHTLEWHECPFFYKSFLYKSASISFYLIQLSLNHFPPYRACTVHLNHFIYYLEAHWRFFCCHKFKHYLRFCEWTCCCCAVAVCNVANLLRQSSHWINGYTRCATLTWLNTDPSPRYAPHFCALLMLFDYW